MSGKLRFVAAAKQCSIESTGVSDEFVIVIRRTKPVRIMSLAAARYFIIATFQLAATILQSLKVCGVL